MSEEGKAYASEVPGQSVLPGMGEVLGYEAIVLKPALERFCWEYVLRGDSPAAAYEVAFPDKERSREQSRKNAHKTLQKEDVRRRVAQIREELKARYTVTANDLVQYHSKVLRIGRDEFLDQETLTCRRLEDLSPEALSILEFDVERNPKTGSLQTVFKVPSRHQSSQELAKILGMHKDKVELTGKDGGPVEASGSVTIYMPDNGRN